MNYSYLSNLMDPYIDKFVKMGAYNHALMYVYYLIRLLLIC